MEVGARQLSGAGHLISRHGPRGRREIGKGPVCGGGGGAASRPRRARAESQQHARGELASSKRSGPPGASPVHLVVPLDLHENLQALQGSHRAPRPARATKRGSLRANQCDGAGSEGDGQLRAAGDRVTGAPRHPSPPASPARRARAGEGRESDLARKRVPFCSPKRSPRREGRNCPSARFAAAVRARSGRPRWTPRPYEQLIALADASRGRTAPANGFPPGAAIQKLAAVAARGAALQKLHPDTQSRNRPGLARKRDARGPGQAAPGLEQKRPAGPPPQAPAANPGLKGAGWPLTLPPRCRPRPGS